jgi:hypothetical protein
MISHETPGIPGVSPYVLIVGCPRSGLTLLARILDAHSQVAIIPDVGWITDYFRTRTRLVGEGAVTPELVTKWHQRKRFDPFEISLQEILASLGPSMPCQAFVGQLFDLCGRIKGKRIVGSLTAAYVSRIRALHGLWPQTKFIHLIRDGRDVCLSALDLPLPAFRGRSTVWTEDRVAASALWWERDVRLGRRDGRELGPELYHEIRYEALVAQPEPECAKLCAFLGIPYEPAMLRFHEGRSECHDCDSHGTNVKNAWQPITPGLRDWRTQMASPDLERFEAAAGGLLDELAYSRAVPCPSSTAALQVREVRDSFVQCVQAGKQPAPQTW